MVEGRYLGFLRMETLIGALKLELYFLLPLIAVAIGNKMLKMELWYMLRDRTVEIKKKDRRSLMINRSHGK